MDVLRVTDNFWIYWRSRTAYGFSDIDQLIEYGLTSMKLSKDCALVNHTIFSYCLKDSELVDLLKATINFWINFWMY